MKNFRFLKTKKSSISSQQSPMLSSREQARRQREEIVNNLEAKINKNKRISYTMYVLSFIFLMLCAVAFIVWPTLFSKDMMEFKAVEMLQVIMPISGLAFLGIFFCFRKYSYKKMYYVMDLEDAWYCALDY